MTFETLDKGNELLNKIKLVLKEADQLNHISRDLASGIDNEDNIGCVIYISYCRNSKYSMNDYEISAKSLLDIIYKIRNKKQKELEEIREEFFKL